MTWPNELGDFLIDQKPARQSDLPGTAADPSGHAHPIKQSQQDQPLAPSPAPFNLPAGSAYTEEASLTHEASTSTRTEAHRHVSVTPPQPDPASSAIPPSPHRALGPMGSDQAPARRYASGPSDRQRFAHRIAFSILAGVVLLTSILLLRGPISQYAQAHANQTEKELLQAKRQAEYEALETDIRSALHRAQSQLTRLAIASEEATATTHITFGSSVEQLDGHASHRPRELDLAILTSSAFARSWAGLVNSRCRTQEAQEAENRLGELRLRLDTKALREDDRHTVGRILAWVSQERALVSHQLGCLRNVSQALEIRRFEERLNEAERND